MNEKIIDALMQKKIKIELGEYELTKQEAINLLETKIEMNYILRELNSLNELNKKLKAKALERIEKAENKSFNEGIEFICDVNLDHLDSIIEQLKNI